jgi:hypothetical protein
MGEALGLNDFANSLTSSLSDDLDIGSRNPAAEKPVEESVEESIEETQEEETVDEIVDDQSDEEVVGDEEETVDDEVDADDADEEAVEEDLSEPEFSTLDDFSEALEVSSEELMNAIKTKVKVNGEEIEVNLKELHDGYQRDADYRRKTTEIAEQKREFDSVVSSTVEKYGERIEEINSLAESLMGLAMQDFSGVDWDQLRASDPGRYAATKADMESRHQQIQNAMMALEIKNNEIYEEQKNKLQTEVIPQQVELFKEKAPEFSTDEGWKDNWMQLDLNMRESYGFAPEEIASLVDHRVLLMAVDAMKYRKSITESEQKVNEIKKEVKQKQKLKASKKVIKPGQRSGVAEAKKSRNNEIARKITGRLAKTGDVSDFAKLLMVE